VGRQGAGLFKTGRSFAKRVMITSDRLRQRAFCSLGRRCREALRGRHPIHLRDFATCLLACLMGVSCLQDSVEANTVMAWVPAYGIGDATGTLAIPLGGDRTVAEVLSRIALQFWIPINGNLALDKRVSENEVRNLLRIARQKNLQVLLCVCNAYPDASGSGFSWDRARPAFAGNRGAFIRQLVEEARKYGLDGVDLDIESERDGLSAQDRSDYAAFVLELARRLHGEGKILTLSSFPGSWFGPNRSWWRDWAAAIDGLQSMGYSDVGMKGTEDWDSYPAQISSWIEAGGAPGKFLNGVSVYFRSWKGASAQENLAALGAAARATGSGAAIWELSLDAHQQKLEPGWKDSTNWALVERIRDDRSP
jgi:Glycosyl hydrolases family 18